MKTALIMEGGAMRGMFTCGVMDALMENGILFDGAAGISAGAVFGCNFKSCQIGRLVRYNKKYCKDPRYCSIRSLIRTCDLYGADFCYRELPDVLDPFDRKRDSSNQIKYDLIGKIATGTKLTRRTIATILQGIRQDKFDMFQENPEEFISKVIRHINEQKATMIVDHITYNTIEGEYDSSIFTAEKNGRSIDQAFKAEKAIQDYVYTDGTAEKSVERKFAEALDSAQEVYIYAKLPRGFAIPTPVGQYSPDWAIVFHEGMVKHIYFVAETKGTMKSLELRPIEKAKIDCAKKLFNKLSDGYITYDHVDSFEQLMNKVM